MHKECDNAHFLKLSSFFRKFILQTMVGGSITGNRKTSHVTQSRTSVARSELARDRFTPPRFIARYDWSRIFADIRVCCSRNSREGANLPSYFASCGNSFRASLNFTAECRYRNCQEKDWIFRTWISIFVEIFGRMNFSSLIDGCEFGILFHAFEFYIIN